MISFDDILQAHETCDRVFREQSFRAESTIPHDGAIIDVGLPDDGARLINDCAYFMMLFARFEQYVKSRAVDLCKAQASAGDWPVRRVWMALDVERMNFLRQVALLTPKGGPDYRMVEEHYGERNRIAHGELLDTRPNVAMIAAKLSGMLARLEGIP